MAKITEQTERFEDMLDAMNKVVNPTPISVLKKEISCQLPTRTPSVQEELPGELLTQLKRRKNKRDQRTLGLLRGYKAKIEGELNRYCNEILNLIDTQLIQKASNPKLKFSITK
jgi:14-3-3 protein epsilon